MALVLADRVREQSSTSGTGTFTLAGAVIGYQSFSSAIGNGNTCYYTISNPSTNEWEVGIGTVSAGQLARTTILSSSNAGSVVNFSAGTKDVFVTYPSQKAVYLDASGNLTPGALTLSSLVVSGTTNLNGGTTIGDASGDAFTINSSAVSIPNGLNFDSNTFVINATNNRVGVGVASPSGKLSVATTGNSAVEIDDGGTISRVMSYDRTAGLPTDLQLYGSTLRLFTSSVAGSGSERMRIDSSGNVGIGTSSNSYTATNRGNLNIAGSSGAILGFQMSGVAKGYVFHDGTNFQLWSEVAGPMLFATNAAERMRIDSSGNLGLGVTPAAWNGSFRAIELPNGVALWSATSGTPSTWLTNNANYISGWTYKNSYAFSGYNQSGGSHYWYNAPSGTAGAVITLTQAMTLDSSGRLLVGMTSGNEMLNIYSASNTYIGLFTSASGTTSSDGGYLGMSGLNLEVRNKESGTLTLWTSNTERMRITSVGAVLINQTSDKGGEILRISGSGQASLLLDNTAKTNGAYVGVFNDAALFGVNRNPSTGVFYNTSNYASEILAVGSSSTSYLSFGTSTAANTTPTERMRIDSSGNVGIGINVPATKFHVQTTGASLEAIRTDSSTVTDATGIYLRSTTQAGISWGSGAYLAFYGGGAGTTERMRLDSSGNLGLGVTPSAWGAGGVKAIDIGTRTALYSGGAGQPILANNFYYNGTSNTYKTSAGATAYQQLGSEHQWFIAPTGTAGNAITFTQAMTLDAGGRLLIGKTSTDVNNFGIQVYQSANTYGSSIQLTWAGVGAAGIWENSSGALVFGNDNSSGTTERMRIDSSGNVLFAKAVRATITTDNDLSFDMNAASNFKCTPTAGGALTFTNITSGQTGNIILVNGSNYAITAAATTKVSSTCLATISATGTYWLSYISDGTNVYVANTGALA